MAGSDSGLRGMRNHAWRFPGSWHTGHSLGSFNPLTFLRHAVFYLLTGKKTTRARAKENFELGLLLWGLLSSMFFFWHSSELHLSWRGEGGRGVARAEPLRLVNRVIVMVVTYFPLLCTTSALLASYLSNPDDILKERWAYLHLSDVTVGSKVELGPSTVSPHNSKPIYLYHVRC